MSLQVWLPLNGDLHNQGLSDVDFSGTITYTDGKLGNCLYSGTVTASNTTLPVDLTANNVYSATYWLKLKVLEGGPWVWRFGSGTGTMRGHYLTSNGAVQWAYNGSGQNIGSDTTLADLKWHHVAITINGAKVTLYIDGISKGSITANRTEQLTSNNFTINSNNKEMYLNDFRIYDHCLSPKEVKELSKGLIAHYPLNDGVGGENLCTSDTSTWYAWNTNATITYTNDGIKTTIGSGSPSGIIIPFGNVNALAGGDECTISFEYKTNATSLGTPYIINESGGNTNYPTIISIDKSETDWKKFTITLTFPSTEGKTTKGLLLCYIKNAWIEIKKNTFKVEKGSVATPWIPNPNDELYSAMGLDNGICYDTSGYWHNGTITGNLTASSDSPRYSVATYFNGSSYAKTLLGELSWTSFDTLTISTWMKPTTTPSNYSGGFGIGHDGSQNYKAFSISNHSGKFTVDYANTTWATVTSSYTMPLNEWHHYAATLDGTTVKMYVDGALIHTGTIDWKTATLHSNPQIQIAVDLPGTDEKFTGYYSDARIYATALSAEDIKQLYEVSASIDNTGNVYGSEVVE